MSREIKQVVRAHGLLLGKGLFFVVMAEDKDPIAQKMARKRWDKTSAKQRSEIAKGLNEARWAGHVKAVGAAKVKKKPAAKKKAAAK